MGKLETLFLYCYGKDDNIRIGCMKDYVRYWCRCNGGNVTIVDDRIYSQDLRGLFGLKEINRHILVLGLEDRYDGFIVSEVIEDENNILEYLLR